MIMYRADIEIFEILILTSRLTVAQRKGQIFSQNSVYVIWNHMIFICDIWDFSMWFFLWFQGKCTKNLCDLPVDRYFHQQVDIFR